MGKLRTRMEQDLVVRGLSVETQRAYVHHVKELAQYHHRSPDRLSEREVQQYRYHLIVERKFPAATCQQAVAALRFFYEVTLKRRRSSFAIPRCKRESKLPAILSPDEVGRVLSATQTLKQRLVLFSSTELIGHPPLYLLGSDACDTWGRMADQTLSQPGRRIRTRERVQACRRLQRVDRDARDSYH
jgi:hypothetical protein